MRMNHPTIVGNQVTFLIEKETSTELAGEIHFKNVEALIKTNQDNL